MHKSLIKDISLMRQHAQLEAYKRVQSFDSGVSWYKAVKDIIIALEKHSEFLTLYIDINEIEGLRCDVICKEGTYSTGLEKTVAISMMVFDKYEDIWGDVVAHDERGEKYSAYSNNYVIGLGR